MQACLPGAHAARPFQAIRIIVRIGFWVAFSMLILASRTIARNAACPGTIHATSLDPIDPTAAIAFPIVLRSPENLEIGESFINGLREAGAKITPDAPLVLDVTFLVTDNSSTLPTLHTDFAWTKGRDFSESKRPTLRVTAGLKRKEDVNVMWVATVDCTVATSDAHLVAHDLGVVLATYFGKQVPTKKKY